MARSWQARIVVWFSLAIACVSPGMAETYPSRPIRVIVPLSAGSVTDIVMRVLGTELSARMGKPWVIDDRPGGNMVIGHEACARAAPDGYTLCAISSAGMSFNPFLLSNLPYDPGRDFAPIVNLFTVIEGVVATGKLPVSSIATLRALATAKSGVLNFATLGQGSTPDVFRQWLNEKWGTDFVGVSYKGGGDVASALLKGEVELGRIGVGNVAAQLQSGAIKVLAVDSGARSPLLPAVPTATEADLAYPIRPWWGLAAPVGTPEPIIAALNGEIRRLFGDPQIAEFMIKQFVEPTPGPSEEFAKFLASDRAQVGQLVEKFKIPRN